MPNLNSACSCRRLSSSLSRCFCSRINRFFSSRSWRSRRSRWFWKDAVLSVSSQGVLLRTINSSVDTSVFVLFSRLTISFCFFSTTYCLTWTIDLDTRRIDRFSPHMFIDVKSDLTHVHIVGLTEIRHRRVNDVHFIQFPTFDTVRFDQLTAVFQGVRRNTVDRLVLRKEKKGQTIDFVRLERDQRLCAIGDKRERTRVCSRET